MLTREEFDEFLTENVETILDSVDQSPRSIQGWLASLQRGLQAAAAEISDDDSSDAGGIFGESDHMFDDEEV